MEVTGLLCVLLQLDVELQYAPSGCGGSRTREAHRFLRPCLYRDTPCDLFFRDLTDLGGGSPPEAFSASARKKLLQDGGVAMATPISILPLQGTTIVPDGTIAGRAHRLRGVTTTTCRTRPDIIISE